MRHGSLFSGVGGFDLAADWMGWENLFHCEWNEFGKNVLKYYWPNATSYDDIKETDFTIWRGRIDVLSGGFPCQPFSTAGKRKGTDDDRHLWPEMLRAIREIAPKYVVGENVNGLLNWNGGMVFEQVQADLEDAGYEVQPCVLPACGVGAPHRRNRVWFIANALDNGNMRQPKEHESKGKKERVQERNQLQQPKEPVNPRSKMDTDTENKESGRLQRTVTDTTGNGRKRDNEPKKSSHDKQNRITRDEFTALYGGKPTTNPKNGEKPRNGWKNFPTQPPICFRDDGISRELVDITFPKWRTESIKAAGNAIVPQVAYEIFKAIEKTENHGKQNG